MRQLLFRQDYADHYTETAIEALKPFGSKRFTEIAVVCRKKADRGDYVMDYGPVSITLKRSFDKPRIAGTMIFEREFEFLAQQIKSEMGLA